MGKKARNRAQRRARPKRQDASYGQRAVVAAVAELLDALSTYARAVHQNRADLDVLALPEMLSQIAEYSATGAALDDFEDLAVAWRFVDGNFPVYGALPHSHERSHESHRRWRGPLTPRELIVCATFDPEEGNAEHLGTYRQNLAANTEHFAEMDRLRQARQELRCGRETAGGGSCKARLVYMPTREGSFDTDFPCRLHLSDEEHRALAAVYATAQRDHDCPGCEATAGQACFAGENDARRLRLVDGEWARKYTYRDHTVHDARLHLARRTAQP